MSAYDAVIFYTVDIFKSTGTSIDPKDSTIILGSVQVIATIPAAFIVDKCGRRLLLMISEIFMFVSLVGMGCFFFLTRGDDDDQSLHLQYGWLPLTSLNVFLIAYSVGIGPLSMILLGEVVPSHIKGFTSCIALMVRWALGFGVTNLFETLEEDIGIDRTYWLFATISGIGAIFVYYCIPETKGRSLDDIQIGFMHPNKLRALQATAVMNNNMDAHHNKDNLHHHDQKG
jgi:MFS family permease